MEDLLAALDERRLSCKTNLYDSSSDERAMEHLSEYSSDSESDWMEAGGEVSQIQNLVGSQDHPRSHVPLVKKVGQDV